VTVELDQTPQHETVLGSDGQNINLKASFRLRDATLASKVEVKVFHRSQSKKKGKKRNLVGSASCSLGDMWKKYGKDSKLRLQCQNPTDRSVGSRGRPQNGAIIHLRLCPPASFTSRLTPTPSEGGYCSSSRSSSPSDDSETLNGPPSVIDPGPPQRLRKRRRVRGYCINSDDEPESYSEEYDSDEDTKALLGGPLFYDEDEPEGPASPVKISFSPVGWLAASLLPRYTERNEVEPELNFFERAISSFTVYREMKRACGEDDFESIFKRLQYEWTYNAQILVALCGVDLTVLGISPDSLFSVNPLARGTVAVSSIASGLGVVCSSWFLVRYGWVDLHTFVTRAEDILSTDTPSFFFFALSARLPSLLTLTSTMSLMLFLALIAFSAWPMAVIIGCFLVGLLMGLQFLVFAVMWVAKSVRKGFRFLVRLILPGTVKDSEEMDEKQGH